MKTQNMETTEIIFRPIGVIHSPFHDVQGMPIQTTGAVGVRGTIEIWPQFVLGLQDLEGFSHIILLYHFHLVKEAKLVVTPFLDTLPRGVFATRAPNRPNPIGLSVVKLVSVEGNILHIEDVDVVDGTPLLDIKPYVPEIDSHRVKRLGWLESARMKMGERRSDGRFR